jgi:hypothetical protein
LENIEELIVNNWNGIWLLFNIKDGFDEKIVQQCKREDIKME